MLHAIEFAIAAQLHLVLDLFDGFFHCSFGKIIELDLPIRRVK